MFSCVFVAVVSFTVMSSAPATAPAPSSTKQASSLYGPAVLQRVRNNVAHDPWAAGVRDDLVKAAKPWRDRSDDELWALMFGPTLPRSWMVFSNGDCPACGKDAVMYSWKVDALGKPWKLRCPNCGEFFPKNDFFAFYRSGLDRHGVFDPKLADRSLLFNADHPDPNDPRHLFGVDDGQGYVNGQKRYRFIAAYLIYGQWKQAVVNGIRTLAAAHLLTGDPSYAHKAGVLLDRVADLYPTFDFRRQAWIYETTGSSEGYVTVWHDACEETREMVMAYDMIFEAIRKDADLVTFLSKKARESDLQNPKACFADIQRNIEERILTDTLRSRPKVTSNYPRTEILVCVIHTVLGGEKNRALFESTLDAALARATAVDGVTGEKGLAGYASFTIQGLASFLAEYEKAEPGFLCRLIAKHPRLRETYRFHIDTHCLGRYYPTCGDAGRFASPHEDYAGMLFLKPGKAISAISWSCAPPSTYSLLWELYRCTGDPAYVQTLYRANGDRLDGLPRDLYAEDATAIQRAIGEVISQHGAETQLTSINKQQWQLGILRAGKGKDARALWLDYDSGGAHSHNDGLNLGLFAAGLDLMPDFGYPPVQYGGWGSPRASWYMSTAAHNTVSVDGQNTAAGAGKTELWADGRQIHAIRAVAPVLNRGNRYERTAVLVDVSPQDSYVVDVFRVSGGTEHTKFMHSHFGTVTSNGFSPSPAADYGHGTVMRNTRADSAAKPGWHVDWIIEDRYQLLPPGSEVHLRYTDFTPDAEAALAEGWVVTGSYDATNETWIPRILVRRRGKSQPPLTSTFLGVIEPYRKAPLASSIRRLPLLSSEGKKLPDNHAALLISLSDGRRDLFIARDPDGGAAVSEVVLTELRLRTNAELSILRLNAAGEVEYAAFANGTQLTSDRFALTAPPGSNFAEWPGPSTTGPAN